MAEKVKIKDKFLFLKKQAVFLPALLFLPIFVFNPSITKITLLTLLSIHYFICFMTPTYLLRYFIKKLNLNQKVVNVFSVISISLMYLFTIFSWISVFISEEQEMEFCAGLFMIPFLSLLKTASVISVLAGGCCVYEFLKKMKEE